MASQTPRRATLCIELQRNYGSGTVVMVLSIPGRQGTVTRSWDRGGPGQVTVPDYESIKLSVLQALDDWLVLSEGLQTVLPL